MRSEIRQYNGKPTVFVDGRPRFPMAWISYYPQASRYKAMGEAGIGFFSLSFTLGDRFYAAYRKGRVKLDGKGLWDAPDRIDFDLLDRRIREILDQAPDALLFPRIFCDSPNWWDSFHPAEVSRTADGHPLRQSFSSTVWLDETTDVLRRIVRHLLRSSYADRIFGIHVAAGETEEWARHDWLGPVDYSLPAQAAFRTEYGTPIPPPEERARADLGDFRDPSKSRAALDYDRFKASEMVRCMEHLCRTVKEESGGSLLTGVFYGYTLVEWRDHFALSLLLRSPFVDFLSSTNGGGRRTRIGEDDMHFLTETDSIQRAGKLFYYEADTRTCLSRWISGLRPDVDPYHEYDTEGWLGPESMGKTLELLKAVFSRVICTGSACWWFDLWGGWYDDARIRDLFGRMQEIGEASLHLPRGSVSQVCVFVDEASLLHYATASRKTTWIHRQMAEIGRLGAPYDIHLLDDLADLDLAPYRMLIFLNAFLLSEERRRLIRARCMRDGRTLFWLYAPGMIGDGISPSSVSSLVDMEIGHEEGRAGARIDVRLPDGEVPYQGAGTAPFLYIQGGADAVFGWTKDGLAVLGVKKGKDHANVLACVPPVPWQVIRHCALECGVHLYSAEGDVVYANQGYLSIAAAKPGVRPIRLPSDSRLEELLGSGLETGPGREFGIDFQQETCRLFRIRPAGD